MVQAIKRAFEKDPPVVYGGHQPNNSHNVSTGIITKRKLSANVISPILTNLFNSSIISGKVPTAFKLAKVIPVHKKGNKAKATNYRPISVLPIVSLILERHVSLHLQLFLEGHKLLYDRQSGFRKRHSCQTALMQITDDWMTAIDKQEIVGTVFLDLSKAFVLVL